MMHLLGRTHCCLHTAPALIIMALPSACCTVHAMQGSPTGANIVTLYSGPAVNPNGRFDGLTNNGTVVAADLAGPFAGKVCVSLSG